MIIGNRVKLKEVANGIYETIRLELVKRGVLPDFTDYDDDSAAYIAAKNALRAELKEDGLNLIDVVNMGSPEERDATKVDTFYINEKEHMNGSIGGGKHSIEDYIDNVDDKRKFMYVRQPARTKDVGYEIRYKSEDKATIDLMSEILAMSLGERGYIMAYNDEGTEVGSFFILNYRGTLDMTDGRKLDKRAQYTAIDLIIYEPEVIKKDIPEATLIVPMIDENSVVLDFPIDIEGSY